MRGKPGLHARKLLFAMSMLGCGGASAPSVPGQAASDHDGAADLSTVCRSPQHALYCHACQFGPTFVGCGDPGVVATCAQGCPTPKPCNDLDEVTCKSRSDCQPGYCPEVGGAERFALCVGPDQAVACPGIEAGTCSALDEASCAGRSDCKEIFCSDCKGGQNFAACQSPGDGDIGCGPCPPACLAFDETTCKGRSDCQPLYCSDCKGGQRFASCVPPGGGGFSCDGSCPAPCANLTTLAACDARTDCHSVFFNPTGCGCIGAGCCAVFSRCADGGKAACKGATGTGLGFCAATPPNCEAPAYVVSLTASCYEGCVRPTECGP